MRFPFFPTAFLRKLVWLVVLLMIPLTGYSQDVRDKVVTLQLDGVTLKQFFDEIRSQTGVDFIYTAQQARQVEPVTIHVTNETLGRVLSRVLADTNLEYTTEGNIITLRNRQKTVKELAPNTSVSDEPKIVITGLLPMRRGSRLPARPCG